MKEEAETVIDLKGVKGSQRQSRKVRETSSIHLFGASYQVTRTQRHLKDSLETKFHWTLLCKSLPSTFKLTGWRSLWVVG